MSHNNRHSLRSHENRAVHGKLEAIAARLQELAQDPALRDGMSEAALARIVGMRGWREYADRAVAVYEALAR